MKTYMLTAYSSKGEVLLNDSLTASNDDEAKQLGEKALAEKELLEATYRLSSPVGKLLLFQS